MVEVKTIRKENKDYRQEVRRLRANKLPQK